MMQPRTSKISKMQMRLLIMCFVSWGGIIVEWCYVHREMYEQSKEMLNTKFKIDY
jgi:hypothetical protein